MFTRGTSLKGPAIVTIGSGASAVQFRTKGDITANFNINTFDILSSERGVIDKRRDDISIQLQFEPVGQITEAMIELLWGWLDKPAGTSIFGNTDTPCVITPLTGKEQITLHASAITNMPSAVYGSSGRTPMLRLGVVDKKIRGKITYWLRQINELPLCLVNCNAIGPPTRA